MEDRGTCPENSIGIGARCAEIFGVKVGDRLSPNRTQRMMKLASAFIALYHEQREGECSKTFDIRERTDRIHTGVCREE